jgi:hypothetical protein
MSRKLKVLGLAVVAVVAFGAVVASVPGRSLGFAIGGG